MKMQLSRLVISGALAAGLAFAGAVTFAQDASVPPPDASAQTPRRGGHEFSPEQQLARMSKRYKLSADQQSQIKPILEDQNKQMSDLRGDTSLSREDRRAKMQSIHSDSNAKIEAILNDTQKAQFDQDQQQMQQRRQERMQQRQGAAAGAGSDQSTPPPPPQ